VLVNPCIEKTAGLDPHDCIREVDSAYSPTGGLTILYGNLAMKGSVVKTAGVHPKMLVHRGPAVIFESQDEACKGILAKQVKPGDVVVIRNEGPKGGPGMQEMLSPTSYIKGMNLGESVALITDGRFSGGTAGACIGHISPEAASGGVIGLLQNGDMIAIDIPNQSLNVELSWKPIQRKLHGYLRKYAAMATSADTGAILKLPE
jgi:dihydroxy-acid dehydratase